MTSHIQGQLSDYVIYQNNGAELKQAETGVFFSAQDSERIRILLAEQANANEQDMLDRRNRRQGVWDMLFLLMLCIFAAGALIFVFVNFFRYYQ